MPFITVRRGPQAGTIYELDKNTITIGRGSKNDIIIDDNDVSRNHCQLVRLADDFEIHDLESTNGTFINGQRVNGNRLLKSGNLIELGDTITLEYDRGYLDGPYESDDQALADGASFSPATAAEGLDYALVVEIGPSPRRIYTLTEDLITVGRDLSNDIVVQDPEISRWHLQLFRHPDGFTIKDLNSTNGTVLNGVRLTEPRPLEVYDTIELGTVVRLYYIHDTEESRQRVMDEGDVEASLRDSTEVSKKETKELAMQFSRRRKTTKLGTGVSRGELVDHIFIAYAREDWENIVAPLMIALQDAGMAMWVDQYLVQGADDWQIAVEQALHECWLMLLILSPDALESRYVKLAYRYFINREKPVIPVEYLAVDSLPPELQNLETLAYDLDDPRRSFQRLIHKIIDLRA